MSLPSPLRTCGSVAVDDSISPLSCPHMAVLTEVWEICTFLCYSWG